MTLPSGTRLGSYEISSPIGYSEGGYILDYPSWSPDGKRVLFSVSRKSGDLYVLEGF